MQNLLKKEQVEREFQEKIAQEMKAHKKKLEQRKVILKEIESETKFRENKKEEALELLKIAIKLDPSCKEYIKKDPEFDNIRESKEFKKLVEN